MGKVATFLRKWLVFACQIVAAALLLALLTWWIDPPLRSNLIEGSILDWQRSENPYPGAALNRTWLLVKMDDGRTVGVASQRTLLPTKGERVLVQERIGLLGTRKFYDMLIGKGQAL